MSVPVPPRLLPVTRPNRYGEPEPLGLGSVYSTVQPCGSFWSRGQTLPRTTCLPPCRVVVSFIRYHFCGSHEKLMVRSTRGMASQDTRRRLCVLPTSIKVYRQAPTPTSGMLTSPPAWSLDPS